MLLCQHTTEECWFVRKGEVGWSRRHIDIAIGWKNFGTRNWLEKRWMYNVAVEEEPSDWSWMQTKETNLNIRFIEKKSKPVWRSNFHTTIFNILEEMEFWRSKTLIWLINWLAKFSTWPLNHPHLSQPFIERCSVYQCPTIDYCPSIKVKSRELLITWSLCHLPIDILDVMWVGFAFR